MLFFRALYFFFGYVCSVTTESVSISDDVSKTEIIIRYHLVLGSDWTGFNVRATHAHTERQWVNNLYTLVVENHSVTPVSVNQRWC